MPNESADQELPTPTANAEPTVGDEQQSADRPASAIVNKPTAEVDPAPVSPPAPAVTPQPVIESDDTEVSESASEPDLDSLFDEPTPPEVEPAIDDSPAEAAPAEDVFDEPAAPEVDAPAEPLVEEPVSEVELPSEEDPLNQLFTPSDEEVPAEVPPAEEPEESEEPEEPNKPVVEDLFGQQQDQPVLHEPGGLASAATRWWTDDGAQFRCEAKLLKVTSKQVVLSKADGRVVAVPFTRLCDEDLRFVHQQVTAQREWLARRDSSDQLASLWSE
ncbi:MAG: hypothetical protein KDA57_10265 [Planctomycetales bacterium]|nr:hypothetical protein [Planctomycetales bacterium]